MTAFQWLALPTLSIVLLVEIAVLFRTSTGRTFRLFRCLVWASAFVAIAVPDLMTQLANFLGIGLGVNLLVYLLTLTFVVTTFFLYAKLLRQQRQFTELVRALALQKPETGSDSRYDSEPKA